MAPMTGEMPSELRLRTDENLEVKCEASFDKLQRVVGSAHAKRIGSLVNVAENYFG